MARPESEVSYGDEDGDAESPAPAGAASLASDSTMWRPKISGVLLPPRSFADRAAEYDPRADSVLKAFVRLLADIVVQE